MLYECKKFFSWFLFFTCLFKLSGCANGNAVSVDDKMTSESTMPLTDISDVSALSENSKDNFEFNFWNQIILSSLDGENFIFDEFTWQATAEEIISARNLEKSEVSFTDDSLRAEINCFKSKNDELPQHIVYTLHEGILVSGSYEFTTDDSQQFGGLCEELKIALAENLPKTLQISSDIDTLDDVESGLETSVGGRELIFKSANGSQINIYVSVQSLEPSSQETRYYQIGFHVMKPRSYRSGLE